MTTTSTRSTDGHDPWWDLDGKGVRRTRLRQRIVSSLAFVIALAACCAVAFEWAVRVGFVTSGPLL